MTEPKSEDKKKKVAIVAGFDKGPRDFFRGSRGFAPKGGGRSFIGMRRGSR